MAALEIALYLQQEIAVVPHAVNQRGIPATGKNGTYEYYLRKDAPTSNLNPPKGAFPLFR
jgi:hypothetical protein